MHVFLGYFKEKGVDAVFSIKVAEDLALLESKREFMTRYKNKRAGTSPTLPMFASACPGIACIFM